MVCKGGGGVGGGGHLGAPIADVVDPHDVMAAELEHATQGVSDDGRSQMTHVHFLAEERGDERGSK